MATKKREKLEQVSHKVIEKKRRDRINNSLAELSQAVPAAFAKQSSGKLEKAEILEMTVEYLRAINSLGQKLESVDWLNPLLYAELQRHYSEGYSECIREVLRYVTEVEGLQMNDIRCIRMMSYLQNRIVNISDTIAHSNKKQQQPNNDSISSTNDIPINSLSREQHRSNFLYTENSVETKTMTPTPNVSTSQCFTCSYPFFKVFPSTTTSKTEYLGLQLKATNTTNCLTTTPTLFHPNDVYYHYNHLSGPSAGFVGPRTRYL